MKRRNFIKSSVLIGSTSALVSGCETKLPETKMKQKKLTGFIFSDAHIGWRGKEQPSMQEQANAIQVIKQRFKDLDVVFDTGDVHHGYLNEKERNVARNHWLSKMANQFPEALFHYIPGNHELGKGPGDTELTSAKLGSMNFRPYYSFDYNGIHFISLPQLLDTILINIESLKWLDHDLTMNRDKTTLIFSHNSIAGTTYDNGENGYRVVINSDEVLAVINKHPNVLAWFHGHNHQYEIVKKVGRLYVSNGRIGGFNPPLKWGPFGQGHLGGIYFSIDNEGLTVKCFSATKNKFLDEVGFNGLSERLDVETSFDPQAECNYYYGHGQMSDNVSYETRNHYLSSKPVEVFSKENAKKIINDNANFELTTELFFVGKRSKRLVGYQLSPSTIIRDSVASGLFINQSNNTDDHMLIEFPSYKFTKHNFMNRGSYFRTESEDEFLATSVFELTQEESKQTKVAFRFIVFSENQQELYQSEYRVINPREDGKYQYKVVIPKLSSKEKQNKYLKVSVKVEGFPKKFVINKMTLTKKVNKKGKQLLEVNDKQYNLAKNKKTKLNKDKNSVSHVKYRGLPASLIFKVSEVKWQIRNAHAIFDQNTINITSYAHMFQTEKEVIITPTVKQKQYVSKVTNLMPVTIESRQKQILIRSENYSEVSQIYINLKEGKLIRISGGMILTHLNTNEQLVIKPTSNEIVVDFG